MELIRMIKKQKNVMHIRESLYIEADANANLFNMKCLEILCFIVLLCELFNEVGIFKVPVIVMRLSTIIAFIILSVPLCTFLIHDKFLHKKVSILNKEVFKNLILISTFVGIGTLCVTLSFHAILLLSIPPLIAAQYSNQKKQFVLILIFALLLVPVSVYGSFFLGSVDRNFVKGMMTDEEFSVLANRITLATSTRMLELFTHYVVPRLFGVLAIVLLVYGITSRNGKMLKRQEELNQKVNEEMENMNKMQQHVIDSLATLIETRDVGTGEHVIRTKRYVRIIADELKNIEKYKDILTDEYILRI